MRTPAEAVRRLDHLVSVSNQASWWGHLPSSTTAYARTIVRILETRYLERGGRHATQSDIQNLLVEYDPGHEYKPATVRNAIKALEAIGRLKHAYRDRDGISYHYRLDTTYPPVYRYRILNQDSWCVYHPCNLADGLARHLGKAQPIRIQAQLFDVPNDKPLGMEPWFDLVLTEIISNVATPADEA